MPVLVLEARRPCVAVLLGGVGVPVGGSAPDDEVAGPPVSLGVLGACPDHEVAGMLVTADARTVPSRPAARPPAL